MKELVLVGRIASNRGFTLSPETISKDPTGVLRRARKRT